MHHQNSLGRQISHEGLTTLGGWEEDKRPPSIAQMALNRKQIPFRRGGGAPAGLAPGQDWGQRLEPGTNIAKQCVHTR